ncbi:MAG: SIMPL domain-containing protein [Candidatus Levybacteria bacterium]|nr:SIMPL domain-containing protein [Candidatus Levybacteria bacterium]
MANLKVPFFTVLFIFAFLYIFTTLFGPLPFSVNSVTTNKTDLFTVDGTGETTGIPDTALLSFGVTKQATTVQQARDQVNEIAKKITDDLKGLGVEVKNIKTTNYSIYPNYDYTEGGQRITGYNVSQNMEVRLKPIDQANRAIDVVTSDGANMVGGVSFVLDEKEQEKLEEQARKQAIDNAKKKAQELANLSGLRLGKVVSVYESPGIEPPGIYTADKALEGRGAGEPTQIAPGENTVRITVSLSYQTL